MVPIASRTRQFPQCQDCTLNIATTADSAFAARPLPGVSSTTSDPNCSAMSLSPPAQTLLLSPPSLSSHPERLNEILLSHDRSATDLQMLDRLALGFVSLPVSTYDTVLILADIDGSYSESSILAEPGVLKKIALSLKPGGHLLSQDGINGLPGDPYQTEAVLAGLISDDKGGFVKPDFGDQHSVPLRIGNKKESTEVGNGKRAIQELKMTTPAVPWSTHVKGTTVPGVGLVNFNDDFDAIANTSSDELIDEDGLLDNDDLARPIIQRKLCSYK